MDAPTLYEVGMRFKTLSQTFDGIVQRLQLVEDQDEILYEID